MKKKHALILAIMMATGVLAQNSAPPLPVPGDTSTPPPAAPALPPPMEPAPAAPTKKATKPKAKPVTAAKKPASVEAPGAPFATNEIAVSKQGNVNVRAQSHINSEIITRLKEGDTVTAMKEVTLAHPKTDEPARWVQIALPEGTHVWVSTSFLNGGTVTANKLKVRSGAGENYSDIGLLHKGDTVKVINTKGEWTEIEAPAGSFGFVAAHLLAHQPAAPPPPPIVTATVTQNNPPPMAPPSDVQPRFTPPPAPPVLPSIPPPAPAPVIETPTKRIAVREGTVGPVVSIQAPTYVELDSLDTGKAIDYLYTTSTNLVLDRYLGLRVLVTGEESLDERWPNTPVLTIQKIRPIK